MSVDQFLQHSFCGYDNGDAGLQVFKECHITGFPWDDDDGAVLVKVFPFIRSCLPM